MLLGLPGILLAYVSRLVFGKLGDDPYATGARYRWMAARSLRVLGFSVVALAAGWFSGCILLAMLRALT
jgi:hypothetical protein